MGVFTSKGQDLYDFLVHQGTTAKLQASSPIDCAAGLAALARVESNYDQGAKGDLVSDTPHAFGYWQINDRVWPLDAARILGDRGYQLEIAANVWRQAEGAVVDALKTIRQHATDAEVVTFAPAKDLPNFYNLAWQYGAQGLRSFVSDWDNLTAEGFADYREFVGKPVYGGRIAFLARCTTFKAEYAKWTANPPSFWTEVVVKSSAQAVALPAQAAAAAGDAAKSVATAASDAASSAIAKAAASAGAAAASAIAPVTDPFKAFFVEAEHAVKVALIVGAFVVVGFLGTVIIFVAKREPAQ